MKKITNNAPSQVIKAFDHVRSIFPTAAIVAFDVRGRWQYMDEDFGSFKFDNKVDVSLLEEASDSVNELPAIFQFYSTE